MIELICVSVARHRERDYGGSYSGGRGGYYDGPPSRGGRGGGYGGPSYRGNWLFSCHGDLVYFVFKVSTVWKTWRCQRICQLSDNRPSQGSAGGKILSVKTAYCQTSLGLQYTDV